jgi:hypothetical protein
MVASQLRRWMQKAIRHLPLKAILFTIMERVCPFAIPDLQFSTQGELG